LYITIIVVFSTAFSKRVSLLSSKIHTGDDTAKDDTPKDDTPKDDSPKDCNQS